MFYTVYKVTNQISGKVYIGTHKTKNLDDGYMGSGKYLKRAMERHGIENFTKEILFIFSTPEEMFAKEAEIVNEDFLSEENTYNIKIGGMGGWDYLNSEKFNNVTHTNVHIQYMNLKRKKIFPNGVFYGKKHTEKSKTSISLSKAGSKSFLGKKHREETKKLMSSIAKQRLSDPTKNSQYGTMWITNGKENRKIKKVDFIPEGWYKGRKKFMEITGVGSPNGLENRSADEESVIVRCD